MKLLRNIRLFIGWVYKIICVGIRNRNIVKAHRSFLKGGTYKNSLTGDYIYEKSSPSYLKAQTFSSLSQCNNFIDMLLNLLVDLFMYRVRENGEKKFQGTEMILSSSKTETKIFSIDNNEVLTKYKDVEKLKRVELDKKYFGQFFNVPETKTVNIEECYVVEKFIAHKKFEPVNAFSYFSEVLINYLYAIRDTISYDEAGDEKKIKKFSNYVGDSKMLHRVVGLPKLMVHGDFWNFNVIYDGRKYYLIDYEKKGVRFFLYDYLCFIFSEYTLLNNNRLLKTYLSGGFDETLSEMFGAIGCRFNEKMREVYFLAFLVEILNERPWSKVLSNELVGGLLRTYLPKYFQLDEENNSNNRS